MFISEYQVSSFGKKWSKKVHPYFYPTETYYKAGTDCKEQQFKDSGE